MTEFAATLSSVVTAGHSLHQRIVAQCTHSLASALQHCHQLVQVACLLQPCHALDFMVIDPAICHMIERLMRPKQSQRLPIKHVINNPWVQQGIKLGGHTLPGKQAANSKGAEKTGVVEDKPLETCWQCPVRPTEALPAICATHAKAVKAQLQMQPTATAGLDAAHGIPPSKGDQGVPAEVQVTPDSPCGQWLHAMGPTSVKMVVYRHWPLQYPARSGRSVEHHNLSSLAADQLRLIPPQAELRVLPAIMPLCTTSAKGTHATASNVAQARGRARQTRVGKRGTAGTAAGVPACRAQQAPVQLALNKCKQATGKGNKKPAKAAASAGAKADGKRPRKRPQHQTLAAFRSASGSLPSRQHRWEALLGATAAAGHPMATPAAEQAAQGHC
ncbi:hypothetical protein ABBQ38_004450 [Trebouxia sp. C0009 RCD-2024]